MEGLERIHQRVLEEAREEARQIETQARSRKDAAIAQEQERADALYEAALAENRSLQQRKRSQLKAELRMEERRTILETKQKWIQAVLAEALKQLANRPLEEKLEDYLQLLQSPEVQAAVAAHPEEKIQVQLCQADCSLCEPLAKQLPETGCVLAESQAFTAGLIVQVGPVHFNYTYEEDIRRKMADWIGHVGRMLFA